MSDSFAARFAATRAAVGPLCWGLDPSSDLLEEWGLGDTPEGLDGFVDIALEAAVGAVGIIKAQSAFYERQGWRGIRTLGRLTEQARSAGLLVIIDAKRGDVGSTNDAYAQAYLGKDAPLACDALTVHPYLGLGAMDGFIARAHASKSCVLIVTRSSNPEGRNVQSATHAGQSVESGLLGEIGRRNGELTTDDLGPIGAVVAPVHITPPLDLVSARAIFLAPGLGAQGASVQDVAEVFATCRDRVIPSASRSLLSAGPDVAHLADRVSDMARTCRDLLAVS